MTTVLPVADLLAEFLRAAARGDVVRTRGDVLMLGDKPSRRKVRFFFSFSQRASTMLFGRRPSKNLQCKRDEGRGMRRGNGPQTRASGEDGERGRVCIQTQDIATKPWPSTP